ncbi:hypothetical protein KCU93_g292, partial [Aureobasidium melanogenum]
MLVTLAVALVTLIITEILGPSEKHTSEQGVCNLISNIFANYRTVSSIELFLRATFARALQHFLRQTSQDPSPSRFPHRKSFLASSSQAFSHIQRHALPIWQLPSTSHESQQPDQAKAYYQLCLLSERPFGAGGHVRMTDRHHRHTRTSFWHGRSSPFLRMTPVMVLPSTAISETDASLKLTPLLAAMSRYAEHSNLGSATPSSGKNNAFVAEDKSAIGRSKALISPSSSSRAESPVFLHASNLECNILIPASVDAISRPPLRANPVASFA